MNSKAIFRKNIRKISRLHSPKSESLQSFRIMRIIEKSYYFKKSETILIYSPIKSEVLVDSLVNRYKNKKTFILPRINSAKLELFYLSNSFTINKFGIKEPFDKKILDIQNIDLAIIPGVAFDRSNNRLGRGKGYYDKLLKTLSSNTLKVGICFPYRLFKKIPIESHDIKMDLVVY